MTVTLIDPFQPFEQEQINARIALTGPAGSGKTLTALTLASQLAERVAAVDTERGRMKEHLRRFPNVRAAHPDRFDPRELVTYLAQAGAAGYGAIVIDSYSHYWMGSGGALEFVDEHTAAGGSKFSSGWKEYRPLENALVDAILNFPGHVIVTMRTKTAYEVVKSGDKSKPVKIGLKPEQREGVEYEFSIVGEMDMSHTLTVTKSTCDELSDRTFLKPGPEVAEIIRTWCSDGKPLVTIAQYRDRAIDVHATLTDLRVLREEVLRACRGGAVVIDDNGDETTLAKLITRKGNEAAAAENARGALAGATA